MSTRGGEGLTEIVNQEGFTKDDFDPGTKAFEEVYRFHGDPFQEDRALKRMTSIAASLDIKGFAISYKAYVKSQRLLTLGEGGQDNLTEFEDQEFDLNTGEWTADDTGVWKYGSFGSYEIACPHPIMPVERLRNIDTGELKVRLAFRRGNKNRRTWNEILTDFDTVSNAKNIVSLSRIGISVTSGKRAQNLVDYIADVMDKNYDIIPERKSVSRLGWNNEGFSPYIGDVVFDGSDAFGRTFAAIHPQGSFSKWRDEALRVREFSLVARIVLASSFASALVEPMGCLPFFVHLWGMASETGKTVGQMVAASVWGEPTPGGEYFKTFKSTTVGFEVMAGFFQSLPIVIDELQLAKDTKGRVIFNVYDLAAGSGKMRSNTKLGISATPRWANCFITSGETPITGEQDGAGALNRVIEVECMAENRVVENGHRTAETVKQHYGHAGKRFVEKLCENGIIERVKARYSELFAAFVSTKATEKQSHSAALITLADELATEWIFNDGRQLTVDELAEFLKSKAAISAAERGYSYMCDWVVQNAYKLRDGEDSNRTERFGLIGKGDDAGWVYIIRSVFYKVCADAGISAPALLSHLRSNGTIQTSGKGFTRSKRIGGEPSNCIVMRLPADDGPDEYDDLPL